MYEKLNDLISSYSHGMKQKITLVGAFIHEPSIVVLAAPSLVTILFMVTLNILKIQERI